MLKCNLPTTYAEYTDRHTMRYDVPYAAIDTSTTYPKRLRFMAQLNGENMSQPRSPTQRLSWREVSFEYKGMFAYHLVMMVLMFFGGTVAIEAQLGIAGAILLGITVLSAQRRIRYRWRWPGIGMMQLLYALVTCAGGVFFLLAATPMFPPQASQALPWYLAGGGIILIGVLNALRIVSASEAEFLQATGDRVQERSLAGHEDSPITEIPPAWHGVARIGFMALFVVGWLCGVGSFYVSGEAFKNGTTAPTITHTEPLSERRRVVFVTPEQKRQLDLLGLGQWSIGGAAVLALLSHGFGYRVISNLPTLAELCQSFQAPTTAKRSLLLERAPQVPVALANVLDGFPAVYRSIRISGDGGYAKVNAQHARNIHRLRGFHITHRKQIPVAVHQCQIAFAMLGCKQLTLALATHKWDHLSAVF
jgi:hypothetical protein